MTVKNKNYKRSQRGRSMVEMLGVLAIIGVLSVAGVAGYKAAVRKSLANNLLNQASMRATDVATKIGSGNLDSLGNDAFAGNLGGGVTMTPGVKGPDGYTDYDESDEQFTLTMEGLDEEMCQQMQSMAGGSRSVVREVECVNNADGDLVAILTFNKDLSANDKPYVPSVIDKNITNPEDCQKAGKTWCSNSDTGNGHCSNSTDCCRGVTAPACKQCQTIEDMYVIGNSLQNSNCDSDGDGTKDGQCLPDGSEEGNLICQQVSCQDTQTCCIFYDMDYLQQLMEETANSGDVLKVLPLIKHLNEFQCGTCDPESGQVTFLPDGTPCDFLDWSGAANGNCVNGSCAVFNPDAFYKSCTSYDNCDSGEYCQFFERTVPTDPKPEKGYCLPLSNWKEESTFQKFTIYKVSSSPSASDWWTSSDICSAMGKRLVTGEELGCIRDGNQYYCSIAQEWFNTTGVWLSSYVDAPYKTDYNDQDGAFLAIYYYDDVAVLFSDVDFDGGPNDNLRVICADK